MTPLSAGPCEKLLPSVDPQPSARVKQPSAESHSGALRARLRRRRASHSHGVVLLLVFVSFVFAATAPDDPWTASVLVLIQSVTLVAAFWTSGLAGVDSWLSRSFVGVAIVAAVLNIVLENETLTAFVAILSGLLTVGIAFVIALSIADQPQVNAQSITGAIVVYLLLGLIFLFVYGTVAELGSGPFFAQGTDGTRSLRLYFSYVTLATLGYGDYTPAGNLGHTLAVVEALLGQLYLVTVVAVLVTRMGQRRERRRGNK
jgi:ion channel